MNVLQFLNSPRETRAWCTYKSMEVYLRKSMRNLDDHQRYSLDIGNIVNKEARRGRGDFWSLLTHLLMLAPKEFSVIYIENVMNAVLVNSLIAQGWTEVPGLSPSTRCFYHVRVHAQ